MWNNAEESRETKIKDEVKKEIKKQFRRKLSRTRKDSKQQNGSTDGIWNAKSHSQKFVFERQGEFMDFACGLSFKLPITASSLLNK